MAHGQKICAQDAYRLGATLWLCLGRFEIRSGAGEKQAYAWRVVGGHAVVSQNYKWRYLR
jgi:hypothetical protein